MTAGRASRAGSRGFSLVWAFVLLVVVGGAASATLARLNAMRQDATVDERDVAGGWAADGALATVRARLARDPASAGETVTVGGTPVETVVARTAAGWTVTARAGGCAVVEADLVAAAGTAAGEVAAPRPPRVVAWRRLR